MLNGSLYIGDFANGVREGQGKEETSDHIYEGYFSNDMKNGKGKVTYKTLNDSYEGEFHDNLITGIGLYQWSNGESYYGSFVNGKMHGKGLYKWPDGGQYEGDYINNIKEGKGVFKWPNGKTFEGDFKKGRPSGLGILKTGKKTYKVTFKDGKIVGRIQGIIQQASNKKWNQKRVRFTRFDSIDDQEVASSLFSSVVSWAKEQGMEEIVGPLGFSDLDREGLLIEGFDQLSTFEEQYNYEYYSKLIENYGFSKEVDWVERAVMFNLSSSPGPLDERFEKITGRIMKKFNLHFSTCRNVKEFIKRYADQFFDIIDETYKDIYATVPFTEI